MSGRRVFMLSVATALLLGVWIRRDALSSGFWSDDYLHRAMLEGAYPVARSSVDLFRFDDGSVRDQRALVDYGYYPWWTHPQFRLAMLRPAPSLLHAADHALFWSSAFAQHVHSFVWWGLGVVAVALLLFAVLPEGAAAIAVVLFALDESHTVPLVWLSNRSLLVATALGTLAVFAHVRHRKTGVRRARMLAIAAFAAALLSGEYALAMLPYLIGFEAFSRDDMRTRARALQPFLWLTLAFLVAWAALGYGTAHSGLYTSPLETPGPYLSKLVTGVPVLVGDLVLGIPADYWTFGSPWPAVARLLLHFDDRVWARLPSWRAVQLSLSLVGAAGAFWLLRRLRSRVDEEHGRALFWLCAGALLGLLPVLGSFVTTRLVLCSSIAAAALFGSALQHALRSLRARGVARVASALAVASFVFVVHGLGAARTANDATRFYAQIARARTQGALAAPIANAQASSQRVVMVAAADVNDAAYLPFVRWGHGLPMAKGFRVLSGSPGSHQLTRIDAHTLDVLVLEEAGERGEVLGSLTRGRSDRFATRLPILIEGLRVQVLATRRGQPLRTRFTFTVPLEDSSLIWLHPTHRGLERWSPPLPGSTLLVPPPVSPDVVFGGQL